MVKIFRLLFVITFLFVSNLCAQNISISASTDTSDYKVGDYIKYTLELKYDKNINVYLPSIKDSIKTLEFIEELKPEKKEANNKVIETHNFIFSKYDSAGVTIPSYKIFYNEKGDTAKKYLAVNTVSISVHTLQVNPQEEIRDVKEPIKLPLDWWLIILIVLAAILLLAAGYFAYRYFKKKKEGKVKPEEIVIIPPHEIALKELEKLEQEKLWQQGLIKEYHSEITEIVRKYFEGRFNFRALELTSSEILACLSYLEEGKEITNTADDFFRNADLVKFAKFEPMPNINEEMMKQAYSIVSKTIPKPIVSESNGVKNVQ